jgi:Flp pilus assembly pilin Flp
MMMAYTRHLVAEFYRDEEGAQVLEYILLTALVGIAAFTAVSFLGRTAQDRTNKVATTIAPLGS